MIIEICSQKAAVECLRHTRVKTSVISITSSDEENVTFPDNQNIDEVLRLRFNDLTSEYDDEGFPYGRPLPQQADFAGLKAFVDRLCCDDLIVHCWEGTSRSAAVASAIFQYRGASDTLRTGQSFAPNPLVYSFSCRELGIRPNNEYHTGRVSIPSDRFTAKTGS